MNAPTKVVLVGLGPKGLFALERLLDAARRSATALDVHVLEPHAVPGAGPVYDPGQPRYLRMNFAAENIDLWPPGSGAVPPAVQRSFSQWRTTSQAERYPPRAEVGGYLADGMALLCRHAPDGVTITIHRTRACSIERGRADWTVHGDDGGQHLCDEVLVAIGHDINAGQVFPVEDWLPRLPAGGTLAIRGFALTCIDACLAATEGRGGTFASDGDPYRLRYTPGPTSASAIFPFSRSGRPMLAKPDPQIASGNPRLPEIAADARTRIHGLRGGLAELCTVLGEAVTATLEAAGGTTGDAGHWLTEASAGRCPRVPGDAGSELEHSLSVGCGQVAPDLQWALGQTWRDVYPALVARLGADGLEVADWPSFRRLSAQMERVAFGPPAINAAKLLALVDAGVVDLTRVACGPIRDADLALDAVIPGPGVPGTGGLLRTLLDDGLARLAPGRRGIEVAPDATCISREGRRVSGLAVLGRATEDWVIGNDTLSRDLHPHAGRWAQRVVRRAAGSANWDSAAA